MSYIGIDLKYKDMCAIKHALKRSFDLKSATVFIDKLGSSDNLTSDKIIQLEKDIAHEKRLIEQFETAIAYFKTKNKIK